MPENLPLTITLKKVDGGLVVQGAANQIKLDMFTDSLDEGTVLEVTYEPIHGDATYAQLSKLHKCIRVIASETGDSFERIKEEIKKKTGLYSKVEHLRSFGGASKEEVSKAIEAVMEMADFLGINLHNY